MQAAAIIASPISAFWLGRLTAGGIWSDEAVPFLCSAVAVLVVALLWMLLRPEAERLSGRKPLCSMTIIGVWDTSRPPTPSPLTQRQGRG